MDWIRVLYNIVRIYFGVLFVTVVHMAVVITSPEPATNEQVVLWSSIVILGFVGSVTAGYFGTRWANW
jgi:hypothetical protein